jgi:hypothetical protein
VCANSAAGFRELHWWLQGQGVQPRTWKPLPKEVQTLRFLLARRQDVQHMLQQERNRLHAASPLAFQISARFLTAMPM